MAATRGTTSRGRENGRPEPDTVFADANDVIVPPPRPRPVWVGRLRWTALAVVVLLAVAGGVFFVERQREMQMVADTFCPGLPSDSGTGFALALAPDGECIGWTVDQAFDFSRDDPGMNAVVADIVKRNADVANSGRDYVRVAVLMPMTGNDTSMMTQPTIRNALRGVDTALERAQNLSDHTLGNTPLAFQVVLANEGSNAAHWPQVVDDLKRMTGGDHPLVAVTGLGASTPESKGAIESLGAAQIPVITAALSATALTSSNYAFHVSASNDQTMDALNQKYVQANRLPPEATGYLVYDDKRPDPFLESLYQAMMSRFGTSFHLDTNFSSFTGQRDAGATTPNLFGDASDAIRCTYRPDVVFFSGRTRDLDALVTTLVNAPTCAGQPKDQAAKPLVILTEAPGQTDALATDPMLRAKMATAKISVVEAADADSAAWQPGPGGAPSSAAPGDYANFYSVYTRTLQFPDSDLADGYAITTHDAVATAIWSTRLVFDEMIAADPTRHADPARLATQNVHDRIVNLGTSKKPVPAAGGEMSFSNEDYAHGRPHGKVVPLVQIPPDPNGRPLEAYTTP